MIVFFLIIMTMCLNSFKSWLPIIWVSPVKSGPNRWCYSSLLFMFHNGSYLISISSIMLSKITAKSIRMIHFFMSWKMATLISIANLFLLISNYLRILSTLLLMRDWVQDHISRIRDIWHSRIIIRLWVIFNLCKRWWVIIISG
jgi:hypothetical protein